VGFKAIKRPSPLNVTPRREAAELGETIMGTKTFVQKSAKLSRLLAAFGLACAFIACATTFITPAHAETIDLMCRLTPSQAAAMVEMGYPDSAARVFNVSIDTSASAVIYAGFGTIPAKSFQAKITNEFVTWTIPGYFKDSKPSSGSFDRNTNVLTTFNSEGDSNGMWNCTKGR
jgi:hypothetical protein